MVYIAENAPLRDRSHFARILALVKNTFTRKPSFPRDLSDHLARDVGLSAHDLEILRHEMPSQSTKHPMI